MEQVVEGISAQSSSWTNRKSKGSECEGCADSGTHAEAHVETMAITAKNEAGDRARRITLRRS
jgi:hypothetical protein